MASEDAPHSSSHPDGLPIGTILGDTYEILQQIALGGMAEVYRAKNIHTDEPVAVKVVLPEFARDQTILALFKKEATILSRLHNDAIVHYHVFTVDRAMNRPYLVMEFVDGIALSDLIRNAPMAPSRVRQLMLRIAFGLSAAHELGVVHRDLSPDNVILPNSDVSKTKIIDFGIAKATVGEGTLLGGKFAGKYNFVSPEQLGLFNGDVTERSDIYSLGLVLAAALLGTPLDMSGTHFDIIEKRQKVPDLSALDVSLRSIVASMLEPDPAHRPQTMRAIIDGFSVPPSSQTDTRALFGNAMPVDPRPAPGAPRGGSVPPRDGGTPSVGGSVPPFDNRGAPRQPSPDQQWARSTPPAERTRLAAPPPPSRSAAAERTSLAPVDGASLKPVDLATLRGDESPFGPYDPGRLAAPLPPLRKAKKRGPPIGWLLLVALVALGGGGFYAYEQRWLGGTAGTPVGVASDTPGTKLPIAGKPADTKSAAAATVAPKAAAAHDGVATAPNGQATTPAAGVPVNTTVVANTTNTNVVANTSNPAAEKLGTAADRIAWLKAYPLDECQYAAATEVADNSFNIEAFGASTAAFTGLSDAFEKRTGLAPNINLRQVDVAQCQAVDFLNSMKAVAQPGPSLSLTSDILPNGGRLEGSLTNISNWSTELLLVDDQGNVYNVTQFLTRQGGNATFALPVSLTGDTGSTTPLPVLVMAISSQVPIAAAHFSDAGTVWTTLRDIGKEIAAKSLAVSIGTSYFQVSRTLATTSSK